ncbi:M24 family metallopeptidase [Nakamurella leprariae]|uniref:Aminopeptidase P family protein n=1 Tax=Nakamurella leprariae TaxID=2803911 RepID=A0A938YDK2_9ACTN|nr:aminopeptidase P family protein [Nakamurella leprariae]
MSSAQPTGSAPAADDLAGVLADRLARLAAEAELAGADVVLVGPGADLHYFLGHSVGSHERLTCLVLPAGDGGAQLLVPALERPGWAGSPVEQLGLPVITWADGQDPYRALADLLPPAARVLAVDDHLPAVHALGAGGAVPGSELTLAGAAIAELRMRKTAVEIDALAAAGAAIDRVQRSIGRWLRAGRTEHEVAADIATAIVAEGHTRPDFVIVGSGPNGASPHHEASDRVIRPGDMVVIDIGGPMPSGYFSDCTRTYQVAGDGTAEPDPLAAEVYEIVRRAQQAGVAAVAPGVPAQEIDAAARRIITDAGYGEHFITRTGHGIGLEVHEHPYIVTGNELPLEPGMAFSVEPGIYLPGRFGVRIEDVVVVGADGPLLMNRAPTELVVLD